MEESNATPQVNASRNENLTFEEKVREFTVQLVNIAPLLCGIGVAIWWIFSGMIQFTDAKLSVIEQIKLTAITVFVALTYTFLISQGGFASAKRTKEYKAECRLWTEEIIRGNTSKHEIIEYAKVIAKQNQKALRIENLMKVGVHYSDIYDDNGELIATNYKKNRYHKKRNPNGYFKGQIRMIKCCNNIKIIIPEMFGNISSRFFGLGKQETQAQFETKQNTKNGITRAIFSFFTVGIVFTWIGLTPEALIQALFQIVIWTASAVLQRVKNYNFVMNNLLPQIVEKRLIIKGYMDLPENEKDVYRQIVQEKK